MNLKTLPQLQQHKSKCHRITKKSRFKLLIKSSIKWMWTIIEVFSTDFLSRSI